MNQKTTSVKTPDEIIMNKIYVIREQKVMLDQDLATLYGVETKNLKRQVKRNIERFPEDFMFTLNQDENESLRCQIGTLKRGTHSKFLPFVFTEHGILMLSSVLNSPKAIQVNIQIMRIFSNVRKLIRDNQELISAIQNVEKKTDGNTKSIELLFEYVDELMMKNEKPKKPKPVRKVGFKLKKLN